MVDAQGLPHLLRQGDAVDLLVGALGRTEEVEGVVHGDASPVPVGGVARHRVRQGGHAAAVDDAQRVEALGGDGELPLHRAVVVELCFGAVWSAIF